MFGLGYICRFDFVAGGGGFRRSGETVICGEMRIISITVESVVGLGIRFVRQDYRQSRRPTLTKSGSVSVMVQDRHVVTTHHQYEVSYDLSIRVISSDLG